jgi:orotidine-5'-phosphate decarboxylase
VGIDPRFELLPEPIVQAAQANGGNQDAVQVAATEEFCRRLIDVVAPLVPAVKPQVAFFEQLGPAGLEMLARVIQHARDQGLIVIADAKRGDIGSTAAAYADAWLAGEDPTAARWAADCLTVNPYLGRDSLQPFVDVAKERGAGLYVLVRTSNPGAADFQDRKTDGQTLYQGVASLIEQLSVETLDGDYGQIGAVVGATWPEELQHLRAAMPHTLLLVPGYGSQGGTAKDVMSAVDQHGQGALINSSRGINFAHAKEPFATEFGANRWEEAVEAATRKMIADLATT